MPAQDDGRQNEREETCRQEEERDDGQQPEINSQKEIAGPSLTVE